MRHETFNIGFTQEPVPVIPHILKTNSDGSLNMVTDGEMSKGDKYTIQPSGITYVIINVVENRKARGDWSGKSYDGMNPTFNCVKSVISK